MRLRGERGLGMVVGIVLIFAFTFLGIVWLALDVDRGVSNRSAAQSIAFQARGPGRSRHRSPTCATTPTRAPSTSKRRDRRPRATADALFASYDVDGSVTSIDVDGDRVAVTVVITDGSVTVTGAGTVRAERAP